MLILISDKHVYYIYVYILYYIIGCIVVHSFKSYYVIFNCNIVFYGALYTVIQNYNIYYFELNYIMFHLTIIVRVLCYA